VKWPPGAKLDNWRYGPIAEELAPEALAHIAALIHATEDKPMALIKGGVGAFLFRMVVVLRREQRLKVSGIVNGMRPGIRREELVMVLHALAQVERHAVIHRTAVGEVG